MRSLQFSTGQIWSGAKGSTRSSTARIGMVNMRPLLAENRWPFKNGIGRTLIQDLLRKMSPVKAHGFRSVVGHYIAGTAGAEELSKALDEIE